MAPLKKTSFDLCSIFVFCFVFYNIVLIAPLKVAVMNMRDTKGMLLANVYLSPKQNKLFFLLLFYVSPFSFPLVKTNAYGVVFDACVGSPCVHSLMH